MPGPEQADPPASTCFNLNLHFKHQRLAWGEMRKWEERSVKTSPTSGQDSFLEEVVFEY